MTRDPWTQLKLELTRIHDLSCVGELMGWDQQVLMPPSGKKARARQMAWISELTHQRLCSKRVGELLEETGEKVLPQTVQADCVREAKRQRERALRLPSDLVRALARKSSEAQNAWAEARDQGRFAPFRDALAEMVTLKRREAEALLSLGYEHLYDALIDEYEPEANLEWLEPVVDSAARQAHQVLEAVRGSRRFPRREVLQRGFDVEAQRAFCRGLLQWIGFDLESGRLDESRHPFTVSFDPGDVRLTTRFAKNWLSGSLFSTLHEGGHGLYEQGLPGDLVGTPVGGALSLGIHESQSRFWENQVGRRRAFWEFAYGPLRETFHPTLDDVSLEEFHFAVNEVAASPIRTEADEVTYNLHIALRFELEKALLEGDLSVGDAEAAWADAMEKHLGLRPQSPVEGILQDIHWSLGLFGYFVTYLLGNLYAAQWAWAMDRQIGGLDEHMARGEFSPLLEWLREHVHRKGRRKTAEDLAVEATGQPLDPQFFQDYLKGKYSALYGVTW